MKGKVFHVCAPTINLRLGYGGFYFEDSTALLDSFRYEVREFISSKSALDEARSHLKPRVVETQNLSQQKIISSSNVKPWTQD